MKIAISGTYSSGKTTTSVALSHLTGIPRTHAKAMREILPEVLPGKRLEDCGVPELFQLGMIRYGERLTHESRWPGGFISDGSSLHEWAYGKIRVRLGVNPGAHSPVGGFTSPAQRRLFEEVIDAMGAVALRHAVRAYDVFVHLPVEFPLVVDGHRPVSEEFRAMSDDLLLATVRRAGIPVHVVGGSLDERLAAIVGLLALPTVGPVHDAIRAARAELGRHDTGDELARVGGPRSGDGERT